MSKITREHIKQGTFIWYSGRTSCSGWNCPAVITRVSNKKHVFYVKSLDDMVEQSQAYDFEVIEHSCDSRKSMRLATPEDVVAYLNTREEELNADVPKKRREFRKSMDALHRFRDGRKELFSNHLKK